MPAAANKQELLDVFDRDKAKLEKLLAAVDSAKSLAHVPEDTTTIRGIIAHRTHWMTKFFDWFEAGRTGEHVDIPAKGYKWNQLKAYNAPIYQSANAKPWVVLLAEFDAEATRLRAFIVDYDEEMLYAPNQFDWIGKWTLGRWLEASGPSHFRSAATYIRKALRHWEASQG